MAKRSIEHRAKEALAFAQQLAREGKTWTEAMNGVYGLGGLCPELFPTREERAAFLRTSAHGQINEVINTLPDATVRQESSATPPLIADLHVQLPCTLLASLKAEATAQRCGLSQLVVAILTRHVRTAANGERSETSRRKRA